MNLYSFVGNDPLNFVDNLGLYEVYFEIWTLIKKTHGWVVPAAAIGTKTKQWVKVETDTGKIVEEGNFVGTTFGVIGALSGFTQNSWKHVDARDCKIHVTMSGWAKNLANPFLGSINWEFRFVIDVKTGEVTIKEGKHDGFPSYKVSYGGNFYNFEETTPDKLKEPMDIKVP